MTLSYFTGEQHSENFEQIIRLAEELGYSVRVYESKESSQFDFLQAVYRDTATIVDATIPDDPTLSTVYPLLTAHVNSLDHILVFSDKHYDDGTQILPLNISPQRSMSWHDKDLLGWLRNQLVDLREHQYYERIEIESVEKLLDYKYPMESIMSDSLELHKPKKGNKKRVMISYRNSRSKEVERFRNEEEAKGKEEIKLLPPGSLTRYLWLATRMGMPTVTKWPRSSSALRAPQELVPLGIEIVQTYNLLTHNQIVRMVLRK